MRMAGRREAEHPAELGVLSDDEIGLRRAQAPAVVEPMMIVRQIEDGARAGSLARENVRRRVPDHDGRSRLAL